MENRYDFKEINKLHYPLNLDGVHDLNNMYLNRYNKLVESFYNNVLDFLSENQESKWQLERKLQLKDTSAGWGSNMLDNLQTIAKHPEYFAKGSKNYRLYYAYLAAHHALVDYYEYRAKYNKKDENLEKALRDWYKVIQPKQNIFARVLSYVRQK